MSNSIFMDWFGGVPLDTLIPLGSVILKVVSLVYYGRWLFLVGFFLLTAGYSMERKDKMERLACYRYGTALNWWRLRFWKGILSGIRKAICMMLVFLACDLAVGNAAFLLASADESIKTGILWLAHAVSLEALFLLLDLCCGKGFVPAAVLLLEGVTFYMGYTINSITNIMYGTWGMYLRSGWHDTRGFSAKAVLAAELLLPAAGYYGGKFYLKKSRMWGILGKDRF